MYVRHERARSFYLTSVDFFNKFFLFFYFLYFFIFFIFIFFLFVFNPFKVLLCKSIGCFLYDWRNGQNKLNICLTYLTCNAANIDLFKVNNRNTRKNLNGVFIVNFEHISHLFTVFLLLTLNK